MFKDLLVITTGGSIDSDPDLYEGDAVFSNIKSPSMEYLEKVYTDKNIEHVDIGQLDSKKDITGEHIDQIVAAIAQSEIKSVLILMGTDGMAEHSKTIQDRLGDENFSAGLKNVRFTGAMLPLLDEASTAKDNLDVAMYSLEKEKNVVRVIMDGDIFTPGEFHKDTENKCFVKSASIAGISL